jgi:hypothetical protein
MALGRRALPARLAWGAALALAAMLPCAGSAAGDPYLEALLARLDRKADLYRSRALLFACDERIAYRPAGRDGRTFDLEYIYVYDEARGFLDYRTRRGRRRGGSDPSEVDPGRLGLPAFLRRAYSWVFVFERAKRRMYRYAIEREETLHGRATLVVRFDPLPPVREDLNDWYGTAWIDRETADLVRVEALKKPEHDEQAALEREAGAPLLPSGEGPAVHHPISRVTTDFSPQANGMALPRKAVIVREDHRVRPGRARNEVERTPLYTVTQTYDRYRFYGVRMRDDLRPPGDRARSSAGKP